jgi:hypothetical protein
MNLSQLIGTSEWADVERSLRRHYPDAQESLEGYGDTFLLLRRLTPATSSMRLSIRTTFRPGLDDEPFPEVVGKNGTLNRDQEDFKHLGKAADSTYALSAAEFGLELESWNEWLGMEIEVDTLDEYLESEIIAHCLYEMTFFGFTEAEISAQREELQRRIDELDAMTEEEKKEKLIPIEQVIKDIETRIKK